MEKGGMTSVNSGATAPPGQPLPTAPPSYEEAVGAAAAVMGSGIHHTQPTIPGVPPYPIMSGPMPAPYAGAGTTHQMPTIAQMPHQMNSSQTQAPEVRVVHQTITLSLGPNPVKMSCPSCHADIKTTTMSDHQPSAHVCCIILCLLGCCLCSCLPYCLSAFLSVHHFCPNCKAYIGTWKG